ncbi:MAG: hypothetical protein JNM95_14015 [Chitinophagaceae bacterium]|nr:hypothetical protein [Chitinophagaceae bacterium]
MKKIIMALCGLMLAYTLDAQQKETQPLPDWVYMIDNSEVNYYEAIKAFDFFWKDRVKPVEEMDEGEEAEKEKLALANYLKTLTVAERNYWDQLQYHYKRFKRWKKDSLPFVQPSGLILTHEQRAAIWYKQQEEIKNLKK